MLPAFLRPAPRVAMSMCVMNEERFLAHHLACHHALGIQRAYVFGDRSTDDSLRHASAFPWVRLYRIPDKQGAAFTYIADAQRACMDLSLRLAREEGFDWLLFIDPDEFLDAGPPSLAHCSNPARAWLPRLLKQARKDTWMVRFNVKEAVPVRDKSTPWHQSHIYFQKKPGVEYLLSHPQKEKEIRWKDFLGHNQGKCCVRTGLPIQAYDPHRWTAGQWQDLPERPEYVPLPTETLGNLLHFPLTGPEHWRSKYNSFVREPEHWFCNKPVETPKQWGKELCNLPEDESLRYYDHCIAQTPEALQSYLKKGLVEMDTSLRERIQELGSPPTLPQNPENPTEVDFRNYLETTTIPESLSPVRRDFSPHQLPRKLLTGFHHLEMLGLRLFRWSGPNASIRVTLPPGIYRAVLETNHLISPEQLQQVQLHFSSPGWIISRKRIRRDKIHFVTHISDEAAESSLLTLNSPPLPPQQGEHRILHIPVFGLHFR